MTRDALPDRLRQALGRRPRVQQRVRRVLQASRPLELAEARRQGRSRLVDSPVFLLSSIRSGSTLLRMMLDAHPDIRAPHELHLNAVHVSATGMSAAAMRELGFNDERLQFALWDRIIHRELLDAGKRVFVDKTPSNSYNWPKLVRCWPQARFIVLRRHPAMVAASWQNAHPTWSKEQVAQYVLRYMHGLDRAFADRGGLLVRYEDLTREPERELSRICSFLGLPFDSRMVDYAARAPVFARRGLGDWSDNLRSGTVRHADAQPDLTDLDPELREIARGWDYL